MLSPSVQVNYWNLMPHAGSMPHRRELESSATQALCRTGLN